MAVPSAVQNRMRQEAAALTAAGIDPNGPPPGAVVPLTPTPAAPAALSPTPAAAPLGGDDLAALRAENERLANELRTQSGRASSLSTEIKELKDRFEISGSNRTFLENTLTEQQSRIAALEQQLAEAQSAGTSSQVQAVAQLLDESGPSEDDLKTYGESQPFVEKVVKRLLAQSLKPILAQMAEIEKVLKITKDIAPKVVRLEESAAESGKAVQRQREESFIRTEVLPHFPDFEQVRLTDEWKKYLQTDTGRGYPIGGLLAIYRQQNNAVGIRAVIGAYYEQQKAKPTLESLAVPGKSTADAPPAPPAAKIKASEYKQKLRDFTMKKLPKDQWDAFRARWNEAEAAGNIEMDIELR